MKSSTAMEPNSPQRETIPDIVFGMISVGLLIGFALFVLWGSPA